MIAFLARLKFSLFGLVALRNYFIFNSGFILANIIIVSSNAD